MIKNRVTNVEIAFINFRLGYDEINKDCFGAISVGWMDL
jgi:hypothetical protein